MVHVIHDYGPVAPSDEGFLDDEFYWLAEVEWHEDLDPGLPIVQRLQSILSRLTGDEPVGEAEILGFINRCQEVIAHDPSFSPLIGTLIKVAEEVQYG